MMKKLLPIAFLLIGFYAQAQERLTVFEKFDNSKAFAIGVTGYLPDGSAFKYGYGTSLKAEWPIAQDISITGTVGYARLTYKNTHMGELQPTTPASFIPITAGAKFFLADKFYFEGDIGGAVVSNYIKSGLFAIELSGGYIFKVSKSSGFDTSIAYQNWGNNDHLKLIALKIAYRVEFQ